MKNIRSDFLKSFNILKDHSLAEYTSWKIGGLADYFYRPKNREELCAFFENWQNNLPVTILGAATNVLIRDAGVDGLVVYLKDSFCEIMEIDKGTIRIESGARLSKLLAKCLQLGLVDAAFLAGIPGTVGGALGMNAGAYGDYIWNHVISVETIDIYGQLKTRKAEDFKIDYRKVLGLAKQEWFVAADLSFSCGNPEAMEEQVLSYLNRRKKSQPLEYPSCGSVFCNPPGDYAARLIEASGLKGLKVGGAQISEKHANFIINRGHASSYDIEELISKIIDTVESKHKIRLMPEVRILGRD